MITYVPPPILYVIYSKLSLFQHLFSIIRGRGGFNDHPTVRQATGALRAIAGNSFLKRSFSNNQNVEGELSTFTSPVEAENEQHSLETANEADEDQVNDQVSLRSCSLRAI